ncbi:MAG: deoxyribose-phosphate aldolase [Ignavibacteriae bacterium]|nr:MAG: deoxyribose-phosphate aldolase [Ignavibacteriota bacterium]
MDKQTILRLIEQVLNETNAYTCTRDGVCTDNLCVVHNRDGVKNIVQSGADRISAGVGLDQNAFDPALARMIDHTLLKPEATKKEIEKLCAEAKQYDFASVCINPSYVPFCAALLSGTNVKVCTVIGFPLGATSSAAKAYEAERAIHDGAREVDMVINVGLLKSGEYDSVEQDILSVVNTAHRAGVLTKVIIETGLLTDEEKVKACMLAKQAGADFVKTSTGFVKGGATVGDIALMRKVVGPELGIKASGGVRSQEDALALIASGADRIGASASVKIVTGAKAVPPSTY